ncbi:GNAT family N-acetyltransferase [Stappia stellulata]|uniref:GNAT family N-acetyltransferase n=1 Tax=Stappia stellulata TaxID=71235 RepID=UPI00041A8E35|nr:GNAT family N-acetyltransferase [Stappia stellulata]
MDILPFVRGADTRAATVVYAQALFQKLRPFFGTPHLAAEFLAPHLCHDRAVTAVEGNRLLGIAGFKMDGTGLFEPGWADFRKRFGRAGGAIRVAGLSFLDKTEEPDTLAMDGIAVTAAARGRGAGTALLAGIVDIARANGRETVRLDVIDTNPRARALYERNGFVPTKVTQIGVLSTLFGFSAATTMVRQVLPGAPAPSTADDRSEAAHGTH